MYLVQTVTSRPRAWSSYTNVNIKDEHRMKNMNSVEEISTYKQNFIEPYVYNSVKTAATTYDFPEHPPKKEKKWSFGNLFRRKKKEESDSSSDEESQKKSAQSKKKRKPDKRKKVSKPVLAFDHIVVAPSSRGSYIVTNGYNKYEDSGILSDPSGGFGSYAGRPLPRIPPSDETKTKQALTRHESYNSHNSLGSGDSLNKKSRRERAKARALARRDSHRQGSSSDEDSQRSCSSNRFKSEESLSRQRDGSLHRRSRNARTERYIKRLSKDDESILNREAMQRQARENWQLNLPEAHMNYGVPTNTSPILSTNPKSAECYVNTASLSQPNFSGLFTIPPSHSNHSKYRTTNSCGSNVNNNNNSNGVITQDVKSAKIETRNSNCFNIRSLSCEANIHKSSSPESQPEVMHVQLPLGKPKYRNMMLIEQTRLKQPPPPPPRDPRRVISVQMDNNRPHEKMQQRNDVNNYLINREPTYTNNWHAGFRTASEDHIPTEPKQILAPRPSSVTNESRNQRYLNRRFQEPSERFQYLTEKKPRSRKPIFIQSTDKINSNNYNQNSSWKGVETSDATKSTSSSPQMFTAQTHVQTKIFLPSVLKADMDNSVDTVDFVKRESSPFKPISSPSPLEGSQKREVTSSVDSLAIELNEEGKRKSANLEEALDELEAIYKSLHLGDEDLLERAEQREMSLATKKLIEAKSESYPVWGSVPRGALSDSNFNYEPFKSVDSPRKKRFLKKSHTLDRKNDDMAFRKLNKERANTINNPQSAVANVSYLLASPVHAPPDDEENQDETNDEPDVTFDDVVYRNIKHANNSLKVVDPQPPFGIPIGPITPAPNSDYLHAVPENIPRYTFKHKKIPDIVKDDLAFRNLRKDPNKEPALKPIDIENSKKKKRAVRSLSANISNLIENERLRNEDCENEFKKTSLTDIADAMEIARQILKEKENRLTATKRAFLSDTEAKYRKSNLTTASSNETITESRINFLNEMRNNDGSKSNYLGDDIVHSKPPRGSTPDRRKDHSSISPEPKRESKNSSFEDLLTALAVEARETSDRITNELNNLDENLNQTSLKRTLEKDKDHKAEIDRKLSEIDAVSEHAKLCEKLLECVVESTELIASTKTESTPIEQVECIETLIPESVANIVTTRSENEERNNPVDVEIHSASEHDYDNLGSDLELLDKVIPFGADLSDHDTNSKSPFEEHKAELIATFKELGRLEEPSVSSTDEEIVKLTQVGETEDKSGGEECVLEVAFPFQKECAFITESQINFNNNGVTTYTTNCNIYIAGTSEELESRASSGYHSNFSCTDSLGTDESENVDQLAPVLLESLKSPKLVNSAMKQAGENSSKSDDNSKGNIPIVECLPSSSNTRNNSRDLGHTLDSTRSWYGDPLVLAFACSYGVACSYQLVSIDVVAILGFLFVILSIAAALILE